MSDPKKLIQLYLDGELDDTDRVRVTQILQQDAGARAEMESYEQLRHALKEHSGPSAEISQSDFMWSRVKDAIQKGGIPDETSAKERTPWWNWDYRWAFAAVAAVVMLALTFIYVDRLGEGEQMVGLVDPATQGYSFVTVYTFDPQVYPAEYTSSQAGANVIWLTGVDAYDITSPEHS